MTSSSQDEDAVQVEDEEETEWQTRFVGFTGGPQVLEDEEVAITEDLGVKRVLSLSQSTSTDGSRDGELAEDKLVEEVRMSLLAISIFELWKFEDADFTRAN